MLRTAFRILRLVTVCSSVKIPPFLRSVNFSISGVAHPERVYDGSCWYDKGTGRCGITDAAVKISAGCGLFFGKFEPEFAIGTLLKQGQRVGSMWAPPRSELGVDKGLRLTCYAYAEGVLVAFNEDDSPLANSDKDCWLFTVSPLKDF